MNEVRFAEKQRFRQWWLIAIVAGVLATTLLAFGPGLHQQLGAGRPWGNEPLSDVALVVAACFAIGIALFVTWLLLAARLDTTVTRAGLEVGLWPIHRRPRSIDLRRVEKVEACTYRPIRDYGGWGVRLGRNGTAYNVSGNRGVRLTYRGGETLLIGSQRAEELAAAIEAARRAAQSERS